MLMDLPFKTRKMKGKIIISMNLIYAIFAWVGFISSIITIGNFIYSIIRKK
nr:MAG TPA: Protein of unknown function (DUF2633) [Caudoviricetes sp.]